MSDYKKNLKMLALGLLLAACGLVALRKPTYYEVSARHTRRGLMSVSTYYTEYPYLVKRCVNIEFTRKITKKQYDDACANIGGNNAQCVVERVEKDGMRSLETTAVLIDYNWSDPMRDRIKSIGPRRGYRYYD